MLLPPDLLPLGASVRQAASSLVPMWRSTPASISDSFVDFIHITAHGISGEFGFFYYPVSPSSPFWSINPSLLFCLIQATGHTRSHGGGRLTYYLKGLLKVLLPDLQGVLAKRIPGEFSTLITQHCVLDHDIRKLFGVFWFCICLEPTILYCFFTFFPFSLCCFQFLAPGSYFVHSFTWDTFIENLDRPSIYFRKT